MLRPGPLDLVALGLGVAAAALGLAANTGPVLLGLAVGLVLARLVRARTTPHLVCWIVVPLLIWIGYGTWSFLAGALCLFGQAGLTALAARGRPEAGTDTQIAGRVTLALATGVAAVALIGFQNIYS